MVACPSTESQRCNTTQEPRPKHSVGKEEEEEEEEDDDDDKAAETVKNVAVWEVRLVRLWC